MINTEKPFRQQPPTGVLDGQPCVRKLQAVANFEKLSVRVS